MAICGSLHSLPLHPFHMVDQTNRGATCMYVYMYVCICDAVFWWIIAPRLEGLCQGFLSSCSPPKIRQHCSLSICKHLINTEANKKNQSDDEASWLVYLKYPGYIILLSTAWSRYSPTFSPPLLVESKCCAVATKTSERRRLKVFVISEI